MRKLISVLLLASTLFAPLGCRPPDCSPTTTIGNGNPVVASKLGVQQENPIPLFQPPRVRVKFLETAADIVMIGLDLAECAAGNGWSCATAAGDVLATLIPFVPAPGAVVRVVKYGGKIVDDIPLDKADDLAKIVTKGPKADKIYAIEAHREDIAKGITQTQSWSKVSERIPEQGYSAFTYRQKFDSVTLRKNMEALNPKRLRKPGEHTHHIIMGGDKASDFSIKARKILADAGINVDDAANGVFLGAKKHLGLHTKRYKELLYKELQQAAGNPNKIRDVLRDIGERIAKGKFPPPIKP